MIEGIEQFFQRIADGISALLPGRWQYAWMDAVFYSESSFFCGGYRTETDGACQTIAVPRDARRAFAEMREAVRKAGRQPWCRARFELYPSGKFNMQWSYDDCDEAGFARFDEAAEREWQRQLWEGKLPPLLGTRPK